MFDPIYTSWTKPERKGGNLTSQTLISLKRVTKVRLQNELLAKKWS